MAGERETMAPAKEYLLVDGLPLKDAAAIQAKLNELGAQGWTFIHADLYYHAPDTLRVWLMR